ncbi:DUF4336 domain-containing protein [Rhodobacter sp. NTK016B]|uniref:DUF4336 domain-containing protein n=1 Tax=Rhodobacter sp. NTK016B TaxID=2759676 RepID=UPI001A8F9F25|nr:DUF4336 domain-containing protein [Rhodobacter sp. NTK016B]MBN8293344.1 DUF4336 domain-containing protein [Rhodobacter sp. NTK016B]
MLTAFGPQIWLSDGPVVTAALGFRYPTRMAVIRLGSGDLVVWSPVALTDTLRADLAGLGRIAHVIAPNSLHDTFLGDWAVAWPAATLHPAPGIARAHPDLAFAETLCDTAPPVWARDMDQVVLRSAITDEVVFFHRPSGTVLLTDFIQQFPAGWHRGWRGLIARLDLMTEVRPTMPRKFRLALRDRATARYAADKILSWPAQRVVMAHGTPVTKGADMVLEQAFGWLRD